jgi:hypothetical protein
MESKRIYNEYGCSPDIPVEVSRMTNKIRDVLRNDYYELLVSDKYDWADLKLGITEDVGCFLAEAHILASMEKRKRLGYK